ncbi:MAG: hypothetical protein ABJN35_01415 [Erythrobacter sp.]
MTLRQWETYFRLMPWIIMLPVVEIVLNGTVWSALVLMTLMVIPTLRLRCNSCDLWAFDHRIAMHFRGLPSIKNCPHCKKPMVTNP